MTSPRMEQHQRLGEHYAKAGRLEEAIREYRAALEFAPTDPQLVRNKSRVLRTRARIGPMSGPTRGKVAGMEKRSEAGRGGVGAGGRAESIGMDGRGEVKPIGRR